MVVIKKYSASLTDGYFQVSMKKLTIVKNSSSVMMKMTMAPVIKIKCGENFFFNLLTVLNTISQQ